MGNEDGLGNLVFEVKWTGDSLLGLLDGNYQVTIIVRDDSQIELSEGETTLVETTVIKAIFDTDDELDYLAVEDLRECNQEDASSEISTTELSMLLGTNRTSNKVYGHVPPGGKDNHPPSEREEREQMGRCSSCGKVINAGELTDGVCRFCRM